MTESLPGVPLSLQDARSREFVVVEGIQDGYVEQTVRTVCIRVHCFTGKNIVITRNTPGPAHFDGEWFETGRRIEISIIPSALKVLVP